MGPKWREILLKVATGVDENEIPSPYDPKGIMRYMYCKLSEDRSALYIWCSKTLRMTHIDCGKVPDNVRTYTLDDFAALNLKFQPPGKRMR